MRTRTLLSIATCALFALTTPGIAPAATPVGFGVRGGVGTDVEGGLAYGAGVNYLLDLDGSGLEAGIVFFGGSFDEESDNGFNTYQETTDILVVGVKADYLIGYSPERAGAFFVAGIGLGSINVDWKEESATDTSLGTPRPGGGSMQEEDGSAGGTLFNVGGGYLFANSFDLRAEFPVIVTFSPPGEASAVVPTFTITGGIRF